MYLWINSTIDCVTPGSTDIVTCDRLTNLSLAQNVFMCLFLSVMIPKSPVSQYCCICLFLLFILNNKDKLQITYRYRTLLSKICGATPSARTTMSYAIYKSKYNGGIISLWYRYHSFNFWHALMPDKLWLLIKLSYSQPIELCIHVLP